MSSLRREEPPSVPPNEPVLEESPSATNPEARAPRPGAERTRTSVAFNSLITGVLVLILLLVFILENTESVKISYFGVTGHMPLGVALLLAAVGGALLMGLAGAARVIQLRRRMKQPRS
jgi:uncharacterized integral membrane protein